MKDPERWLELVEYGALTLGAVIMVCGIAVGDEFIAADGGFMAMIAIWSYLESE